MRWQSFSLLVDQTQIHRIKVSTQAHDILFCAKEKRQMFEKFNSLTFCLNTKKSNSSMKSIVSLRLIFLLHWVGARLWMDVVKMGFWIYCMAKFSQNDKHRLFFNARTDRSYETLIFSFFLLVVVSDLYFFSMYFIFPDLLVPMHF